MNISTYVIIRLVHKFSKYNLDSLDAKFRKYDIDWVIPDGIYLSKEPISAIVKSILIHHIIIGMYLMKIII